MSTRSSFGSKMSRWTRFGPRSPTILERAEPLKERAVRTAHCVRRLHRGRPRARNQCQFGLRAPSALRLFLKAVAHRNDPASLADAKLIEGGSRFFALEGELRFAGSNDELAIAVLNGEKIAVGARRRSAQWRSRGDLCCAGAVLGVDTSGDLDRCGPLICRARRA